MDELLELVGLGDRRAFGRLYDLVVPRVFGVVRRCLVDHSESEEVTQEVLLEIWKTAPRFDRGRGHALSWILTIAHRRAVDRVRASQASHTRDLVVGIRDLEIEYDHVSTSVEVRLEHARAMGALARLTPLQRESIDLAYVGGLTTKEIALRLGVPVGTVKTRIRDGLASLRDKLTA